MKEDQWDDEDDISYHRFDKVGFSYNHRRFSFVFNVEAPDHKFEAAIDLNYQEMKELAEWLLRISGNTVNKA